MDIKDSYLHNTVGVIKSIDVEEDKLKYKLADKNNTEKVITLPLATQNSNGLLSKNDKIIIDSVSNQLTKPHHLQNNGDISTGWIRIFSGTYQHYGTLSIKHGSGNVKLIIDFINNYSSLPYIKYINGIPTNTISKIRFVKNGDYRYIDIYNLSAQNVVISFSSRDTRYQSSLPMILVNEDVSSYTVYEYDLYSGNWSNMSYISNKFIGNLQGNADTATEATHATRANFATEANHALNADEAIHSETADLADDLGGKPETHEENFIYQPTAADLSIKDGFADIKKLKGNTLVWNQLSKPTLWVAGGGATATYDSTTGTHTLTTLESQYNRDLRINKSFAVNHKYLIKCSIKSNYDGDGDIFFYPSMVSTQFSLTNGIKKHIKTILHSPSAPQDSLRINIRDNENVAGKTLEIKDIQLIDLTKMFGAGNEPTIEEFEAMFPDDYYEYNEGELMSFDGKGVKSVGFNQWDEEWELGSYNTTTGDKGTDLVHLRNVNPIKVLGGTDYYFKSPVTLFLFWYDSKMKFIKGTTETYRVNNSIIKSPSNAAYLNFYQYTKNTYDNDICINLSHSGYRDGEYEPYEDYTLSFQDDKTISQLTGKLNGGGDSVVIFPDGLRSAGEAFDEIVYDEATGKHRAIKRIGSVDMGTLDWRLYNNIYTKIDDAKNDAFFICSKYECLVGPDSMAFNDRDKVLWRSLAASGSRFEIYVRDSAYADVDIFKTAMSGVILYYELKIPEVYELDFPINTSYEAYDFGTEEVLYNDEVNIPMKASIEYGFNAVDMIRGNYFDIQKLKKKAITTDGGVIEGDLRVDNLIASKSVTSPTFIGNLEGRAKNADKADAITQSTTNETNTPILVRGTNNTVTYNPNFTLNKFNEYLPLAGGAMSGNIDMRGNEIKNTNFELVESLPTENLYEGRQVTYEGKIYTYHNEKWISTADDLGDLKEILSGEFIFRPTADTHSVKDEFASVKSIKGNTVVWNQLNGSVRSFNNYGVTQTQNDDGTFTLNGTATQKFDIYNTNPAIYKFLPIGHKGLFNLKHISGDIIGNLRFSYGQIQLNTNTKVIKTDSTNYRYLLENIPEGCVLNNATFSFQVYDLTQMFGEGNEPATVEEFEKLYSHLPIDYNEGSLLNLNADSIKSVGFNLFDKTKVESESYLFYNTGISTYNKNLKENVSDFIRVIPGTKYYVKNIISHNHRTTWVYDSNKMPLTTISASTTDTIDGKYLSSKEITIPDNAYYIRFGIYDEYLDSACINFSHNGERDGEYQSYEEHIVNLPIKKYFPDGLKSAGAAYDEIVFDKNIGKYKAIQRIGSVDMGTLSWGYNDGSSNPTAYPYGYFTLNANALPSMLRSGAILCARYTKKSGSVFLSDKNIGSSNNPIIYITDSSYTDAASLKTSLQGQILYYELAEPIETIVEDYDLVAYKANDWGTEEIISEEPTTPIKADIEYNFDGNEIIKYNYFRIDEIKKDYLHKDGIAVSAEKLARPVKLWGNNFDGSYDVNGIINYGLKVNNTEDRISLLNIESVIANINYSHLYVTSTDGSNPTRPLVLLKGYGNVGIGLENPTEKLEVSGNVKATSFIGNLDWSYIQNKPTSLPANGGNANTLGGYTADDIFRGKFFKDEIINTTQSGWVTIASINESIRNRMVFMIQSIGSSMTPRSTIVSIDFSWTTQKHIIKISNSHYITGVRVCCINGINYVDVYCNSQLTSIIKLIVPMPYDSLANANRSATWYFGNLQLQYTPSDSIVYNTCMSVGTTTYSDSFAATSFLGNLDGTYVNKLTDYTKATSASNIAAIDSLNTALGKLEYKADLGVTVYDWYQSITQDDTDTLINKWGEIVDFLDSVTEGTDIIDEFVTRKTDLTITGLKTFQSNSDTTGIPLILKNNSWTGNMSTALDFYNGRMYTVPNARIETKMVGSGSAGGTLIFYTQGAHANTNPNPNGLTERMRIDDLGKISITGPLFINGTNSTSANLAFSRSGYNYITFPSDGYLAIGKDTSGAGTYVKFTSTDLRPERSNEINLGSSTNLFKNIYSDKIITTTDVVINNKSLLNILPANNTWSNRLNKQLKDVTTVTDNSYIYIKTPLKCSGSDTDNGMNIIEINIYQHKPSNVATGVSKILLKWYGYDLLLNNYYRSSYAVLGEWVGQVYVGLDSSNNYNIIIHNPTGFNRNTIVSVPYFLSGFNNTVDCSTGWSLGVSLDLSEFTVYKNSVLEQQTSSSFKVLNGTSSQFLKADGSLDSNKYLIAPNNVTNSYVRSININGISYDFLSSVNNSSSTIIYSPTTSGTQGLVITSSGEGAPVWTNQSSLSTNWNKYTEKSVKLFTKKWTRVLLFDNYNNFLLNISFSQSSQSCVYTYLINTGWGCAKIIQLGCNNYSTNSETELRICRESSSKFYLDVYNPYGYNNVLETYPKFKLINILSGNVSFLTEFLDVTDSTETILDSLISRYNYASNFKSHYSLLSDDSSKLEGSTKNELLQSASSDAASKYLPLTGGILTGSLNISGGLRLNIYNSSCKLSLTSADGNNFIQSASNDFSSNKPLYITGPNASTGSDLYLKFSNIYCRNNYINLDSNNYSSYALPLTGGVIKNGATRNPLTIDTTNEVGSYINFAANGVAKAYIGYSNFAGAFMEENGVSLKLKDGVATLGNYIMLHSNNYSTYALPLTGGILSGAIHRTYSHNSSEGDVWICPKDAPQFGIRYFEGDVDKMTISASGNNTNISASDLCINGKGDGTVTIRGNSILHEGNYDSFISPKYSFHKKYSTLSELPEGTEGWYKIGKVMDSSGSPSLFMIKAYAHSSAIFTVIKGWDSGYITILNSTTAGNASYAYIKAIRILNSGEVEILLNKPSTNNSNYVKISISMYNPDNIKLYDTLTLDTNSEITILDSKTLKSNCVISNKFLGEFDLKNINSENDCIPSNNSVQFFRTTTTSTGGNDGYIQSFSWNSGSFVTQMFFDADPTHKVFLRNRSGEGVWNEWRQFAFTDSNITGSAAKLTSTKIINEQSFTLSNTKWENTGYTFANLESGTYAIQVTSGTNLVASGIMSIYKNLSDTIGDEIPLHVYGTAGWRPYLRTYENKLLISSNDIENTSRTVTIKIA